MRNFHIEMKDDGVRETKRHEKKAFKNRCWLVGSQVTETKGDEGGEGIDRKEGFRRCPKPRIRTSVAMHM